MDDIREEIRIQMPQSFLIGLDFLFDGTIELGVEFGPEVILGSQELVADHLFLPEEFIFLEIRVVHELEEEVEDLFTPLAHALHVIIVVIEARGSVVVDAEGLDRIHHIERCGEVLVLLEQAMLQKVGGLILHLRHELVSAVDEETDDHIPFSRGMDEVDGSSARQMFSENRVVHAVDLM